jgi:hypothetical protein
MAAVPDVCADTVPALSSGAPCRRRRLLTAIRATAHGRRIQLLLIHLPNQDIFHTLIFFIRRLSDGKY